MRYITHICANCRAALKTRLRERTALLLLMLAGIPKISWGHQTPSVYQSPETRSLTQALERAKHGTQLNIFYVHGMGISPPDRNAGKQDFAVSEEFRTQVCKRIHCTSRLVGRDYADRGLFKLNSRAHLQYLGKDIWVTNEEWNAAAPFVDHYDLDIGGGTTIFLHEINWWPLIIAAKCRQMVAAESALVDRDKKHIYVCSAPTSADVNGRYKSFSWLSKFEIGQRKAGSPKAAVINRWAKHDILDWGFADALLAVGPLREYLIEGIREIVLDSYKPAENQEFVIVSHSLGSYLIFSALDLQNDPKVTAGLNQLDKSTSSLVLQSPAIAIAEDWRMKFDDVLAKTSHAYFMANQLRLLELANLDKSKEGEMQAHLRTWSRLRGGAHIVAFSDPDDFLTWLVPEIEVEPKNSLTIQNVIVINARRWCWLWLFANPQTAHLNYDHNKAVLQAIFPTNSIFPLRPQASKTRKEK